MNRKTVIVAAVVALLLSVSLTSFAAGRMAGEKAMHPRIAHAIQALEGAIDYMQKAPHDFGGHRAAAVEASQHAIEQLRLALAYRAGADAQK
jgi:hypothetical protein